MNTELDLFSHSNVQVELPHGLTEADLANFRAHCMSAGTWQTRRQICAALGWDDRKVRQVAEAIGSQVVRGQEGYKLSELCTRDDLHLVKQSYDAFLSQASKMQAYALSIQKLLHSIEG
jgi:hypothetical protein